MRKADHRQTGTIKVHEIHLSSSFGSVFRASTPPCKRNVRHVPEEVSTGHTKCRQTRRPKSGCGIPYRRLNVSTATGKARLASKQWHANRLPRLARGRQFEAMDLRNAENAWKDGEAGMRRSARWHFVELGTNVLREFWAPRWQPRLGSPATVGNVYPRLAAQSVTQAASLTVSGQFSFLRISAMFPSRRA